jgi:hypothetical protein
MLKAPLILMPMTTIRTCFGKGILWSLVTVLALCTMASAQFGDSAVVLENPSARFHSLARAPYPLSALPAQVQAANGQLTLWADYGSADQTSVPLYLVNRTSEAIPFRTQDGELGIKLEYKNERCAWTRAQAHIASGCGNSYYPIKLSPGHFFKLQGYRAAKGGRHPVRYTFYMSMQLSSNLGEGLVSPEDIAAVERDPFTWAKIPRPIYDCIRSCIHEDRSAADLAECTSMLHILPRTERNELLLDDVRTFRDFLSTAPATRETQEALQVANSVLEHKWSSDPSTAVPITRLCLERLLETSGAPQGSNSIPERLAWQVLEDRAIRDAAPRPEDLPVWKPVLARAEQVIRDPATQPQIKISASRILTQRKVVDSLVSDDTAIGWLKSTHKELRSPGVQALMARGQSQLLMRLARDLSPEEQMSVLSTLARTEWLGRKFGDEPPPPPSHVEMEFWTHCFTTQPLASAAATTYDAVRFGNAVRLPLREFLIQEARRGLAEEGKFPLDKQQPERLSSAVLLLDKFQQAEDDSLLRDLANHRTATRAAQLADRALQQRAQENKR